MTLANPNEVLPPGIPYTDEAPVKDDHTVQVTLNAQVLSVLRRYDLDINKLFILLALYDEAIGLLDSYDNNSTSRGALMQYEELRVHGFITLATEGQEVYCLEEKGKHFVEQIRILFEAPEEVKTTDAEIKALCEEYLQLWPRIKLPSGVYARVSIVEIEKKMKTWFKVYKIAFKTDGIKITPALVIDATKSYLSRYAKNNYNYMVNSSYFIQKKEKSTLADEILAIKQGTIKNEDKWTKKM